MKDYITYLKFDDLNEESLFRCFENDILHQKKRVVMTPNLDILRVTYKNGKARAVFNSADYSTIDGRPLLKLAKKEKKKSFVHKISGSDMVVDFLPIANEKHWSIVLFGGKAGVAEKAAANITSKYPNIQILDTICPDFGFENDLIKIEKYVSRINRCNPNIVLLCVGSPKQEFFFYSNKDKLCNSLFFCVGATIDFLAGTVKRAPKWMSKVGLEWLYRMFKDFKRLFPRYWKDGWFLVKIKFLMTFNKRKIDCLKNS